MNRIEKTLIVKNAGQRLDQFLASQFTAESRTTIKKWISDGAVLVNQKPAKSSYKVAGNDEIVIAVKEDEAQPIPVLAQNIPLDIVYEDEDVLVINKPRDMVIHPSTGHFENTLVNALVYHAQKNQTTLSDAGEYYRPGIVHRLDKDTSGLLVVAKTNLAYASLVAQLQDHTMLRRYTGLVYGEVYEKRGTIDAPIRRHPQDRLRFETSEEGREAITHFEVIKRYFDYTLLEFQLETGRTHQIRVHAQFMGHPIVDDPLYARAYHNRFFGKQGQLLHAHELNFTHPRTGQVMRFTADLPADFKDVLAQLTIKMV